MIATHPSEVAQLIARRVAGTEIMTASLGLARRERFDRMHALSG
jgi:hypothetical protein